jgi:hypothetical protein
LVRYWPGGNFWPLSRLRPPKPLVMMPIGALPLGQPAKYLMWHCPEGCG